jgi:DNA-binding CsgD family transcriptional regulator
VGSRWIEELVEQAATVADSRALILSSLATLVPYDSAIFADPIYATPRHLLRPPATVNKDGFRSLYFQVAAQPKLYRPTISRIEAVTTRAGVIRDGDAFSLAERQRSPFYADVVAPQGIASQLLCSVGFRGRSIGLIHLCRHDRGRFRSVEVERVAAARGAISLVAAAVAGVAREPSPPDADLTARERQVVALIARGLVNKEIAALLGTSVNTVRNQVAHLLRKTGCGNRTALALLHRPSLVR